ncbi:MAG: hypothetical protein ABEK50_12025 [bacterium]
MTDNTYPDNFVPLPYRRVSYRNLGKPLTADSLRRHLIGQDAYHRTEFLILRNDNQFAIATVELENRDQLFSPINSLNQLAEPDDCIFAQDESVDVGIPSSLAGKAANLGVGETETLIVEGLYSHMNFIHKPNPLTVHLFDVTPPDPPKLKSMAEKVLSYAKLPAIRLNTTIIDMVDRARETAFKSYLFPCRASGVSELEQPVYFLDEHPEEEEWVLVGCERTQSIYDHFYDTSPERIEMCPRKLHESLDGPVLIRCCQLEEGFNRDGLLAEVPWGAELDDVEQALRSLHSAALNEGGP